MQLPMHVHQHREKSAILSISSPDRKIKEIDPSSLYLLNDGKNLFRLRRLLSHALLKTSIDTCTDRIRAILVATLSFLLAHDDLGKVV